MSKAFAICQDHQNAEWNQPALEGDACILCRLFYLEAQESLLEEWQQRAQRAEAAIAEMERPLDAQMARLNATVARLNGENERLQRALTVAPSAGGRRFYCQAGGCEKQCVNCADEQPASVPQADGAQWSERLTQSSPPSASVALKRIGPETCDRPGDIHITATLGTGEWYCNGCGASHLEPRCKYRKSVPSDSKGVQG